MHLPDSPFATGTLQFRPIEPVGNASHIVLVGRVQVPVRTQCLNAHVKLLNAKEFAAESVCAWLARALALPAPEPLWVRVSRSAVPVAWPFGNNDVHLCFGTQSVRFAQSLNLAGLQPEALLQQYAAQIPLLARIGVFDELVGNDDRHEGNVLVAPGSDLLLIDHERALGGAGTGLFSTPPLAGPNHLLNIIRQLPTKQRFELKAPLIQFCAACATEVKRIPFDVLIPDDEALREAISSFLCKRATGLRDVVTRILGIPDLPGMNDAYVRPPAL